MNCFVGRDVTPCGDVMTSALKMEAAGFSVSSVHIYQTTRCYIKRRFYDMIYDTIFIYCSWVSTQWQRSVDLYKNWKETAIYRRGNNTQNSTKHRIHKIDNKHTNQKQTHKEY